MLQMTSQLFTNLSSKKNRGKEKEREERDRREKKVKKKRIEMKRKKPQNFGNNVPFKCHKVIAIL